MKYNVTINLVVDTSDYTGVKTPDDVRKLVRCAINGTADWPNDPDLPSASDDQITIQEILESKSNEKFMIQETDAYKRGYSDGLKSNQGLLRENMVRKTLLPETHWMHQYAYGWLRAQSIFSGGCP